MNRGKVIGAIVLVAAIGLVISQRVGDPVDDITTGDTQTAVGAGSAAAQPAGVAATNQSLPAQGIERIYALDAAQSELYWRIYRGGAAARLGHSHVISAEDFAGSVTLVNDLALSEWTLSFDVTDLVIDDPELRARHGEEFESVPSEDDKAGTKENMLTDRVLNGAVYPEIRLNGQGVTGPLDNAVLPVSIQMLGRTIDQSFPAVVSISPDALTVTGEYRLTHEDLGMEPFSLFGGIIAVGENIDFSYRIHAVAGGQ